ARLGGLLHDFCHVPLGHTIEDDLKVLTPHDANADRFDRLWAQLDEPLRLTVENARSVAHPAGLTLKQELQTLILSKENAGSDGASSYPFVADIVGNTISADLIDYLQRDHLFSGLPIALGDRFVDDFYVMASHHKHFAKKMVVRISRDGHPRSDVVTELVKYLRFRYELTERVLMHHTKIAADAMVGKLLEIWSDIVWLEAAADSFPTETAAIGHQNLEALKRRIAESHPGNLPDDHPVLTTTDVPELKRSAALSQLEEEVRGRLESEFTSRSDDGLMEHLARLGDDADSRAGAVRDLAQAVLNRRLFKMIGHAESPADVALADEKYTKFGSPTARRELEREASQWAELRHGWQVVLWLPNPEMRLKVAGVLVDNGSGVARLDKVSGEGRQIVEQHKRLWSVSVFADLDVDKPADARKAQLILASLRDATDLQLVDWNGEEVRSLERIAVDVIAEAKGLSRAQRDSLLKLTPAALGGGRSFQSLLRERWQAGVANQLLSGEFPPELQGDSPL
ncbi:MAG: putative phosphohydrolase, partial [Acidimicrobiaceae bacterium]|nr:putative phosphohydrolase [Acidimicrobiaceae bacterium]